MIAKEVEKYLWRGGQSLTIFYILPASRFQTSWLYSELEGKRVLEQRFYISGKELRSIQPCGCMTYHKSLVTKPDPGPRLPVLTLPCLSFPRPSNQQVLQGLISPSFPLQCYHRGVGPYHPRQRKKKVSSVLSPWQTRM